MADMAQNLKELKEISALLAQHAIGQSARAIRPAALSRLTPPDDFIPALTSAEAYQAELTRHKNQLSQQRVQFSPPAHDAPKPLAQEPQRSTNITMASVSRTIPASALTFVNTNSFNIENMNAENNLKSFVRQVPGKIGVHRGWRGWRGEPSVTLSPWACYLLVNFRLSVTQYTRTPPIATPALREPSTRRCEACGPESTLSPSGGNSVLARVPDC